MGVAIGLLAQWLFVDARLGINAPIALAALLAGAWLLRPASRPRPRARDAWLAIAAVLFASFAALRGDMNLVDLDLLAALVLGGLSLASFAGSPSSTRRLETLAAFGGAHGDASRSSPVAVCSPPFARDCLAAAPARR